MAACAMLANGALGSSICRASPTASVSASSSVCFFFSPSKLAPLFPLLFSEVLGFFVRSL
jgi:hypothetical protein